MIDWLLENVWKNFLYDFIKFCLAYGFSRWLYEGYYKSWRYGGWVLIVMNGNIELARRNITPIWAGKIFNDEYDFSIYVKSFVSPYFYLNLDVASEEAKIIGLTKVDHNAKQITIDQANNRSPFTQSTPQT